MRQFSSEMRKLAFQNVIGSNDMSSAAIDIEHILKAINISNDTLNSAYYRLERDEMELINPKTMDTKLTKSSNALTRIFVEVKSVCASVTVAAVGNFDDFFFGIV